MVVCGGLRDFNASLEEEWVRCVTRTHVRIPVLGIYESMKNLFSKTNTVKELKYSDIRFYFDLCR